MSLQAAYAKFVSTPDGKKYYVSAMITCYLMLLAIEYLIRKSGGYHLDNGLLLCISFFLIIGIIGVFGTNKKVKGANDNHDN